MKFIGATVEEFVCPGITELSEFLGMSEDIAAVTLVALANGAGDVITALVAGSSGGGVSYNIGSLYGSGFFVCSIVISMTILKLGDTELRVSPSTIKKDIAFYIFATLVTIGFGVIGNIYWWSAALFLVIYVVLVIVTVI
jgi:sodium/potassium/calcium exchanger 6